jgi:hypothetical protein
MDKEGVAKNNRVLHILWNFYQNICKNAFMPFHKVTVLSKFCWYSCRFNEIVFCCDIATQAEQLKENDKLSVKTQLEFKLF